MEKKKWTKSPQELIDLFYTVMETFPEAELRKMFGCPCAFHNNNMFVGVHQSNIFVRLEKEEIEKGIAAQEGRRFEPMEGRVMKEYLSLNKQISKDPEKVNSYIAKSMEYVKTLPKKYIKRKKKLKVKELPE